MKAELLLKGTVEARAHLLVAMIAAALPLLVAAVAMLVTRSRVGGALAAVVAGGLVVSFVGYSAPLPSGKIEFVQVDGLRLPNSTAARGPQAQPLLALTPHGLWVGDAQVVSVAHALEDPRVREQNPEVLPLAVDGRVPFSELVDVLDVLDVRDAAGAMKRHDFDVLVQSASGELAVVRVRNAASIPPNTGDRPELNLTVRLTEREFEVSATGGSLGALPLAELSNKLKDIKVNFPSETNVRVTAGPELSMDALVKALDEIRETQSRKLLFPDIVVGRFDSPVLKQVPPPQDAPEGRPHSARVEVQAPELESPDVDREKLATYVRSRKGAILSCYEAELLRDPRLHGKLFVRFSITSTGRAADIGIEENTLGNDAVATCTRGVIANFVFPFKPATPVAVVYPFVFSPAP